MVNHGLVVAPLFVIVAILVERTGTEDLREMGGMAMKAPVLAALFLIVTLATLAMPGSANFIGEFYILNGLFDSKIVFAFVAISGVAMSAYYALRLYQRTMHNRKPDGLDSREIGWRDGIVLVPAGALHPRPGALPAADPEADRRLGVRASAVEGRRRAPKRARPPSRGIAPRSASGDPVSASDDPRRHQAKPMNFNAPHIDYAGALAGPRADRRPLRRPAQRRLQAAARAPRRA